ncbi:extracellular triacylglycerol lipase precursor [Earliella scabrosa]|nr:extracellular triacylglycerol lipase precursor [Earliella scabrosa]
MFSALVFAAFLPSLVFADRPQVTLGNTTLLGKTLNFQGVSQQDFFGGIPFAEPPVGPLRFAPPIPKTLAEASLDASTYGAACPQFGSPLDATEDCLTLNVLRPSGPQPSAPIPVMAWIFGGGFNLGNTSIYNASHIVQRSVERGMPVVYVSFNYRLGPFGFPQGEEAASRGALNLGLKDQLLALKWIRANIHAFGGDPTKVTVFGESAGAISISLLYLNSGLGELVRAAIMESGSPASFALGNATLREFEWQNLISSTPECVDAQPNAAFECLRAANTSTILQAYNAVEAVSPENPYPFGPVIDGPGGLIPDRPYRLLAAGNFARIPFIAGTNTDEGTLFVPTSTSTEEQVLFAALTSVHPTEDGNVPPNVLATVKRLMALYPADPAEGSPFGTGNETFGLSPAFKQASALIGDIMFQAPRRAWVQSATLQGVKVYSYLFNDRQAVPVGLPMLGVSHAAELFNVYGQSVIVPHVNVDFSDVPMMDYWISFATSLDPNDGRGEPRLHWPQYSVFDPIVMQFTTPKSSLIPDTFRFKQLAAINAASPDINH